MNRRYRAGGAGEHARGRAVRAPAEPPRGSDAADADRHHQGAGGPVGRVVERQLQRRQHEQQQARIVVPAGIEAAAVRRAPTPAARSSPRPGSGAGTGGRSARPGSRSAAARTSRPPRARRELRAPEAAHGGAPRRRRPARARRSPRASRLRDRRSRASRPGRREQREHVLERLVRVVGARATSRCGSSRSSTSASCSSCSMRTTISTSAASSPVVIRRHDAGVRDAARRRGSATPVAAADLLDRGRREDGAGSACLCVAGSARRRPPERSARSPRRARSRG